MSEHTKEPWACFGDEVFQIGREDRIIAHILTSGYELDGRVAIDARRIVACVNACAGTSNDELAEIQHYGGVERVFSFWQETEKQRNELLAALERVCEWERKDRLGELNEFQGKVFDSARATIARVKGQS